MRVPFRRPRWGWVVAWNPCGKSPRDDSRDATLRPTPRVSRGHPTLFEGGGTTPLHDAFCEEVKSDEGGYDEDEPFFHASFLFSLF